MKVSTKSLSYRLNNWWGDGYWDIDSKIQSMNSCQYIRYTVWNMLKMLGAGVLILIGVAAICLMAFFILSATVGYIALLIGPLVGYSDFLIKHDIYDLAIFFVFFGSFCTLVIGTILMAEGHIHFWPDYLKPNFKQPVKQEEVPSVWKQHLKNVKDKVCTQVEIVEEKSL